MILTRLVVRFRGCTVWSVVCFLVACAPLWAQSSDAAASRQTETGVASSPTPTPTSTATATPPASESNGQEVTNASPGVAQTCDGSGCVTIAASPTPLPTLASTPSQPVHSGRILWVIPNYRTIEEDSPQRVPQTSGQKFKMAAQDSFDFSSFLVAGFFGGLSMAEAQYKEFGDGADATGKYLATAFADQAIGNFMTEAIFPSLLHQDPQYYTKGHGGFWRRTRYALSREVITFSDDGHSQFNTSEIVGNAVAAGIAAAYYPAQERSASNTMQKWGQQIATDAFFNVLKEFWPDVRRKVFRK